MDTIYFLKAPYNKTAVRSRKLDDDKWIKSHRSAVLGCALSGSVVVFFVAMFILTHVERPDDASVYIPSVTTLGFVEDSYVKSRLLINTNNFSLDFDVKRSTASVIDSKQRYVEIWKWNGGKLAIGIRQTFTSTMHVVGHVVFTRGSSSTTNDGVDVLDDAWHHVKVTVDTSTGCRLSVDDKIVHWWCVVDNGTSTTKKAVSVLGSSTFIGCIRNFTIPIEYRRVNNVTLNQCKSSIRKPDRRAVDDGQLKFDGSKYITTYKNAFSGHVDMNVSYSSAYNSNTFLVGVKYDVTDDTSSYAVVYIFRNRLWMKDSSQPVRSISAVNNTEQWHRIKIDFNGRHISNDDDVGRSLRPMRISPALILIGGRSKFDRMLPQATTNFIGYMNDIVVSEDKIDSFNLYGF